MTIYVRRADEQEPGTAYELTEAAAALEQGKLTPMHLASYGGEIDWKPITILLENRQYAPKTTTTAENLAAARPASAPPVPFSALGTRPWPSNGKTNYYIVRAGQVVGPCWFAEVGRQLDAGQVSALDLCWREGSGEWVPVNTIPGLGKDSTEASGTTSPTPSIGSGLAPLKFRLGCGGVLCIIMIIVGLMLLWHAAFDRKETTFITPGLIVDYKTARATGFKVKQGTYIPPITEERDSTGEEIFGAVLWGIGLIAGGAGILIRHKMKIDRINRSRGIFG